jgi:inorganic pyrophosphatase
MPCRWRYLESPNLSRLPPFDEASGALKYYCGNPQRTPTLNVSTTKSMGCSNSTKPCPTGFSFPFEFGFVPSTIGGDGDPLDVLVLSDEATFPGSLVLGQVLGVLPAEQREGKKVKRSARGHSAECQEPGTDDSHQGACQRALDLVEEARKRARKKGK